jgi:hypothetical protein
MPTSVQKRPLSSLPETVADCLDQANVRAHCVRAVVQLVRFVIPHLEERYDVKTRSCLVFRGQKSNSNRIHSGRSNYMDSRHYTFVSFRDTAHMPFWHASFGHDSLMERLKSDGLRRSQAASVVRLNHPCLLSSVLREPEVVDTVWHLWT